MEKDYQKIDAFLEGGLTTKEQADFERCLHTDNTLKQDLDWVQMVQAGIRQYEQESSFRNLLELQQVELEEAGVFDEFIATHNLQNQIIKKGIAKAERQFFKTHLQNINNELESENKLQVAQKPKGFLRYLKPLISVAAVALILLAVGLFYFPQQSTFQAHFKPYESNLNEELNLVLSEQGAAFDMEALQTLQKGLNAYQQTNYTQAIPLFETYLNNPKNSYQQTTVKLYLSNAYLATNQGQKAIELLQTMGSYEAQWYLALAHLQMDNQSAAKKILEKLSEVDDYQERAKVILESL